jgi:hypothetical protein
MRRLVASEPFEDRTAEVGEPLETQRSVGGQG